MTDVGNEDALSHPPKVPEEPLEPTIKYNQRIQKFKCSGNFRAVFETIKQKLW